MTRHDLTDLLAQRSRIKKSKAAEEVGRMVHEILRTLRNGKSAPLPGLGRFEPGPTPTFKFEKGGSDEGKNTGR